MVIRDSKEKQFKEVEKLKQISFSVSVLTQSLKGTQDRLLKAQKLTNEREQEKRERMKE